MPACWGTHDLGSYLPYVYSIQIRSRSAMIIVEGPASHLFSYLVVRLRRMRSSPTGVE